MKIGALAKQCGIAASAIRFYETKGLLKSIPRKMNGYREYPKETIALLTIIISAQQAGFSLDEIKQILPSNTSSWEHDKLIFMLNRKIADIENLEKKLKSNKSHLKEILHSIENKPKEITCSDNAERVIKKIKSKKQSK